MDREEACKFRMEWRQKTFNKWEQEEKVFSKSWKRVGIVKGMCLPMTEMNLAAFEE